jgi:lysophospholipase L1-like esterase
MEKKKVKNENYLVNSPEFETTVNEYIANLNAVMEYIKSVNPKAKVYVATQYNPYAEFKGKKITMIITMDLNSIYSGMEEGVTKLNAAISENAIKGGYTVVDVKTVFDSAMTKEGTDLYNADSNMKTFNVDFHPNAAGHKVIANEFIKNLK